MVDGGGGGGGGVACCLVVCDLCGRFWFLLSVFGSAAGFRRSCWSGLTFVEFC